MLDTFTMVLLTVSSFEELKIEFGLRFVGTITDKSQPVAIAIATALEKHWDCITCLQEFSRYLGIVA